MAHILHNGHVNSPKSSGPDVPSRFGHIHPTNIPQHVDPMVVEAQSRFMRKHLS